eukprot:TRINITY_DN3801_c0_g1_i1.p1 TRINITY_DN3801_c0_g1~~TRINITY_DN3801_c0_g1_i1.p1  ORF type:complete len:793 (+),score=167.25 TRINITY_DN3801_c0_g1_i1:15-2393(+)
MRGRGFGGNMEKPEIKNLNWKLLWRIYEYARPHKMKWMIIFFITILNSTMLISSPFVMKRFFDSTIEKKEMSTLNKLGFQMIFISILKHLFGVVKGYYKREFSMNVSDTLQLSIYEHLLRLPIHFYKRTKSGEIVSRLFQDVRQADSIITDSFLAIIGNFIDFTAIVIMMLYLNVKLTILGFLTIPLYYFPSKMFGKRLKTISVTFNDEGAELRTIANENLNVDGSMLTKLFVREKILFNQFQDSLTKKTSMRREMNIIGQIYHTIFNFINSISTAFFHWIGGILAMSGYYSLGTIIAFSELYTKFLHLASSFSNLNVQIMQGIVAFERIFEILDLSLVIEDKEDSVELKDTKGGVEFCNVSFNYEFLDKEQFENHELKTTKRQWSRNTEKEGPVQNMSKFAINNVSFNVNPGQVLAIIGKTGSGKTTTINLLCRLYDTTSGEIKIDGKNIKDYKLESLLSQIGVVPQDTYLFHDTLKNNLLIAKPNATDEELIDSLKKANIYDLFENMPQGLETILGQRGYRLSGGERQRIAIARVFLKDPKIVILDEATSSIDVETEKKIQSALLNLMNQRTAIVIAHRLSTILGADNILVLKQGELCEFGPHSELIKNEQGEYHKLYSIQFKSQKEFSVENEKIDQKISSKNFEISKKFSSSEYNLSEREIEEKEEKKKKFGLSNFQLCKGKKNIFFAEKTKKNDEKTPEKVKMRKYESESQSLHHLNILIKTQNLNITPRILGWESKRIVSQFIEGKELELIDLKNEEISDLFCEKLALTNSLFFFYGCFFGVFSSFL